MGCCGKYLEVRKYRIYYRVWGLKNWFLFGFYLTKKVIKIKFSFLG